MSSELVVKLTDEQAFADSEKRVYRVDGVIEKSEVGGDDIYKAARVQLQWTVQSR